jgi:hypothetical protein
MQLSRHCLAQSLSLSTALFRRKVLGLGACDGMPTLTIIRSLQHVAPPKFAAWLIDDGQKNIPNGFLFSCIDLHQNTLICKKYSPLANNRCNPRDHGGIEITEAAGVPFCCDHKPND